MVPDDTDEYGGDDVDGPGDEEPVDVELGDDVPTADDRAGGATEAVDQRIVDLLSWILDTETRAKIYVHLLANPGSTSEEVAKGTGLYPSTVREALAELHDEGNVDREKRASEGAGNNPYEYTAIQPSELVGGVVDQVQNELNTIFTLDRILDRGAEETVDEDVDPVTITVDDVDEGERTDDSGTVPGSDDDEPGSAVDESDGDDGDDEIDGDDRIGGDEDDEFGEL